MTRNRRLFVGAIILGAVSGGGFVLLRPPRTIAGEAAATTEPAATQPAEGDKADKGDKEEKAAVPVQVAPIRVVDTTRNITIYGSVAPAPGSAILVSAAIESRVLHLHTTAGQAIQKGAVLLEMEPSPDARLQMLDAKNGLEAAKKNLADAQQKFDLKLATNSDLLAAQQALQSAQLKYDDLQKRGAGEDVHKITADADASVTKIDAQEGQLVAAGGAVIELLQRGKVEVAAGVEPSQASALAADLAAQIFPSSSTSTDGFGGKIRMIADQINPTSRLVDVFITPDDKTPLILGDSVRAELKIPAEKTMTVPMAAVMADDDGISVYVVKDSKVAKKPVKVLFQTDRDAAITGEDLHDGDSVVVQGSLELDDGVAVTVEGSK